MSRPILGSEDLSQAVLKLLRPFDQRLIEVAEVYLQNDHDEFGMSSAKLLRDTIIEAYVDDPEIGRMTDMHNVVSFVVGMCKDTQDKLPNDFPKYLDVFVPIFAGLEMLLEEYRKSHDYLAEAKNCNEAKRLEALFDRGNEVFFRLAVELYSERMPQDVWQGAARLLALHGTAR